MDRILSCEDAEPLKNQKSPPAGAEELEFGTSRGRASTLPATIHAVGPEHSTDADVDLSAHDAGDTKPQVDFQWFERTGSMLVQAVRYAAFAGVFRSLPTLPERITSPSLPSALMSRTKSRTASRARISCG